MRTLQLLLWTSAAALASGCTALIEVVPTPSEQLAMLEAVKAHEVIDLDVCVFPSGHPAPPKTFMQAFTGADQTWDHQPFLAAYYRETGAPPFRSMRAVSSLEDSKGCDVSLKVWSDLPKGSDAKNHLFVEAYSGRSHELLKSIEAVPESAFYDYEKAEYQQEGSNKRDKWESASLWRASRLAGPLYAAFRKDGPLYAKVAAERRRRPQAEEPAP